MTGGVTRRPQGEEPGHPQGTGDNARTSSDTNTGLNREKHQSDKVKKPERNHRLTTETDDAKYKHDTRRG